MRQNTAHKRSRWQWVGSTCYKVIDKSVTEASREVKLKVKRKKRGKLLFLNKLTLLIKKPEHVEKHFLTHLTFLIW